jgi:hypothetical protein
MKSVRQCLSPMGFHCDLRHFSLVEMIPLMSSLRTRESIPCVTVVDSRFRFSIAHMQRRRSGKG